MGERESSNGIEYGLMASLIYFDSYRRSGYQPI
jgi:hypothetical protein